MIRTPKATIASAAEIPDVVQLDSNLFAAAFRLMKLLPARYILERARATGRLTASTTVIETSSGTFGLALAMICALKGYSLYVVGDIAIDARLKRRLEDLGTRVVIVPKPASVGGFQAARLERVRELQQQFADHFTPDQYGNPENPGSYAPVAELLVETLGSIDCVVGTVGSGGSTCGVARFLRLLFPHLYLVGVDTHGSVIFGMEDRSRPLRGLGNSLLPENVRHTVFDEVHWVGAAEAFRATHELHTSRAMFMGGTSGAAYLVASWWARDHPDATVVCLLPDEGYRYQDTVYNTRWLNENHLLLETLPLQPTLVEHPDEVADSWSCVLWGRRTRDAVLRQRGR